jgi:hypothetical protein
VHAECQKYRFSGSRFLGRFSGNLEYYAHLKALRKAWLMAPEVFTSDLMKATYAKPYAEDNWPEVVLFMKENSEKHRHLEYAEYTAVFSDLNVDGAQLMNTGVKQAVPVLARPSCIVNNKGDTFYFSDMPVFMVGIFIGTEKPDSDDMLLDITQELIDRHPGRNPAFQNAALPERATPKRFRDYLVAQPGDGEWPEPPENPLAPSVFIGLDRVIADAPARKDLTGTAGHGAYWGMTRCKQRGVQVEVRDERCH